MEIHQSKFECDTCEKFRLYTYFTDVNSQDKLISTCSYCQKKTKPTERYIPPPNAQEDERKCRRCGCIKHQDLFIWISKDGKRTKFIKTCQKCRVVQKRKRTCIHGKYHFLSNDCKKCVEEKAKQKKE